MSYFKNIIKKISSFFIDLGISCEILVLLLVISFPVICVSVFHENLDATGNLVTIRTAFSTIIGYILEKSTCTATSDNTLIKNKIIIAAFFSITSMLIVVAAYFLNTDVNNPSLILIKNLLFSSIGFLTSASKESCRRKK